jgi:IS5 family transposase
MRRTYHAQLPLTSTNAHPRAIELCEMNAALDANLGVLRRVRADLLRLRKADAKHGREGMTAEQVVRAALVKQMFGSSYEELAFHLSDSLVLRGFCRLSPSVAPPKRSTLQANIASIRPETWEAMNKALVLYARERKVEDGRWMRTDTTVVESNIHHPLDSSLLFDGVRVLTRTLLRAHEKYGTIDCNHRRRAKRRALAILHVGTMAKRIPLYKDLLKITHKTVRAAERALEELTRRGTIGFVATLSHFLPLVKRLIDQAERRVLRGESVPAAEKLVSLFEPHTGHHRQRSTRHPLWAQGHALNGPERDRARSRHRERESCGFNADRALRRTTCGPFRRSSRAHGVRRRVRFEGKSRSAPGFRNARSVFFPSLRVRPSMTRPPRLACVAS